MCVHAYSNIFYMCSEKSENNFIAIIKCAFLKVGSNTDAAVWIIYTIIVDISDEKKKKNEINCRSIQDTNHKVSMK